MHLFDESVCPPDLILLSRADEMGQGQAPNPEKESVQRQMLARYRELMAQPQVRGQDLMENGITPGPVFSPALAFAHSLHLSGVPRESALRQTLAMLRQGKFDEEAEKRHP